MISAADVWPVVKLRLGLVDDSKKPLIDSYINEIGQRIRHYCNRSDIPDDLLYVWASMVVDAVRVDQPNDEQIAETVAGGESVKIGDTSTAPAKPAGLTNTAKSTIDAVVLNYRVDLNRYRRFRW